MITLAIETSSVECSVAIAGSDGLVAVVETLIPGRHDSVLDSLVGSALASSELSIAQVDRVAVSSGPGSFTGLRIGIAYAKGLCAPNGPTLHAVPTMWAIAAASQEIARVSGKGNILCVIPSNRDLLFTQVFSVVGSRLQECTEVALGTLEQAVAKCGEDVLVAGPGAPRLTNNAISGISRLSARFLLRAMQVETTNGSTWQADPLVLEPQYQQEFTGNQSSSPSSSSSSSSSSISS